jgi:hypothetical protein
MVSAPVGGEVATESGGEDGLAVAVEQAGIESTACLARALRAISASIFATIRRCSSVGGSAISVAALRDVPQAHSSACFADQFFKFLVDR